MKKEAEQKQLNFWINRDIHNAINAAATKRNITMKKWIMAAISAALIEENKYE